MSQVSLCLYATFVTIILTECCWFTACVAFRIITFAQKTSTGSSLRLELRFLSSPTFFWGPVGVGGPSPRSWYIHSSLCCLRLSRAKVKKCRPPEWWTWGQHVWMETYMIQGQSRWRHEHHESRLKNILWAGWELIKHGLRQLFAEVWFFNSVLWFMRSDKSQSQHHPSQFLCLFKQRVFFLTTEAQNTMKTAQNNKTNILFGFLLC